MPLRSRPPASRESILTTSQQDQAIRLLTVLAKIWTEVRPGELLNAMNPQPGEGVPVNPGGPNLV